ncbi:galactosyltransferase [Enterobacter cloacae]|nr:galactosyltransferase [Enterobacter cloacae]
MDILSESITDIFIYGENDDKTQGLNIAYGVDRHFLFGAAISMQSIVMHNDEIGLTFHIFTDYIDDNYLTRIQTFTENYNNVKVCIYKVSNSFVNIFPSLKQWSYATFFRFIAFEHLSNSIDNVLYIDADVICKGKLDGLLKIKFDDNYFAAVVRDVPFMQDKPARRLNIDGLPGNYFNAGVVLLKLQAWREKKFLGHSIKMLESDPDHTKYKCLDQDILNILFYGHCIFISKEYDCFYGIDYELKNNHDEEYLEIITAETKLIHYVGVTKPWNDWTDYPCQKYFNEAYKISAWKDISFIPAVSEKQFHVKSKHAFKNKNIPSAIFYFILYYRKKLIRKYFS